MKYLFSMLIILSSLSKNSYSQDLSQTDKLYATCKVWGYLKYYHPKVADGKFDIDQQLFDLLEKIEEPTSTSEFSIVLIEWINSFGKIQSKIKNSDYKYFDKNFNLGWINDNHYFTSELSDLLNSVESNRHKGKKHYVTYSREPIGYAVMTNENQLAESDWSLKEIRLLCLFRYWNFVEYFFPYKYQTDTNWDKILIEMIPEFANASSKIDYHLAMLALSASVNDSHSSFITRETFNYFGDKFVPFRTHIFNNAAVVTSFIDDSISIENDIRIGDIITQVNNQSIESLLQLNDRYIMGSNLPAKRRRSHDFIFKGNTDSLSISFIRNDRLKTSKISRYHWKEFNISPSPPKPKYKLLENNIGYINLEDIEQDEIEEIMLKLKSTKSLIIDIRNYPNGTLFKIFDFISSEERPFFYAIYPDLNYPGRYIKEENLTAEVSEGPKYQGKVILLVNSSTQSHAEYTAMCLQKGDNIITIGSQTSGADGTITNLEFVGGYKTKFTGVGIFYPDGTETQRNGVKIDIVVKPTVSGVSKGIDEQLEKAIEVANE